MEKQLRYVLMLSLEEIALRRIAVALYNEPYILASIAKSQFKPSHRRSSGKRRNIWRVQGKFYLEWCKTVIDKTSKLPLPKSFTKQMLPILKAVGSEIYKWKLIHEAYLRDSNEDFNVHALGKLCWTTAGVVDYRKTAEELVRCDVVDIVARFELACLYCLEHYIPMLWKELPEGNKRTYCRSRVETPHLQLFLPYILSKLGYLRRFTSRYNSFGDSTAYVNKTLAEYYFRKLRKEERETSLVRGAKDVIKYRNQIDFYTDFNIGKEKLSDVLCYFLSQMTSEEQIRIFKELPCEVLICFLDWPWQHLFWDIADVIWTFLPESKYEDLLFKIYESIDNSGYYFPNFFQYLFLLSPKKFRKHFIDEEIEIGYFFWDFFINEDTEIIKVVFRNVDAADRMRLVSSERGLHLIYQPVLEWHVKEVFLREATLSEEDKGKLKEAFIEFARRQEPKYRNSIDLVRRDNRRFFEFVEETDAGAQSKSSSEDETFTKV